MNFDLGSLSDNELQELLKSINEEKEARYNPLRYKSGIGNLVTKNDGNFVRYISAFEQLIYDKGIARDQLKKYRSHDEFSDVTKSCFRICDKVLGNFNATVTDRGDLRITCSGSRILLDDPTEYAEMYQELFKVIDKHLFKEDE